MTDKRVIKRHPLINFDKPSLIKREAVAEQLREALEAIDSLSKNQVLITEWTKYKKSFEGGSPRFITEDLNKLVKALQEGLTPINSDMEISKEIDDMLLNYNGEINKLIQNSKSLENFNISHRTIKDTFDPVSDKFFHLSKSEKAIKKALNNNEVLDRWSMSQKTIEDALKPLSQNKEIFGQWKKWEEETKEALSPVRQYKEIFDQLTKWETEIKETFKPNQQYKEIIDQWTNAEKTIKNALKPVILNSQMVDTYSKVFSESIEQFNKYSHAIDMVKKIASYKSK